MARILVIDDEQPIRASLGSVLVAAGHSVREAREGKTGVAAIRREPPDLVVCDLVVPGWEWAETIQHVRRLSPALPIVAIGGGGWWGATEMLYSAFKLGATAVLAKPIPRGTLLRVIDELLGAHGTHRRPLAPTPSQTPAPAPQPPATVGKDHTLETAKRSIWRWRSNRRRCPPL